MAKRAISPYLSKQVWFRRAPRYYQKEAGSFGYFDTEEMRFDDGLAYRMYQSDFMDELVPSAHKINHCEYRSMRPKYRYNATTQANELYGYEEVERVSVGFQEGALRHKVTTTFGNEMWFGSEGKDEVNEQRVATIRSHWGVTGMTDALNSWGRALFGTGDAAIYLYKTDGQVHYKVFSFEKGDVFNFTKNENNEDIFVRLFKVSGVDTIEIYDKKNVEVWVRDNDRKGIFDKAVARLKGKIIEESSDGWVCIERKSHGCSQLPVIYHRISDVVWGVGQDSIDRLERIMSDLGENNRYYAYQILFIAGGILSLPPSGDMGKVIASKTTDGKAEILKPADASNTFTVDLEKNLDLLCETLALVIINPKELKAGENTGAFIRNLYWREVQWSTNMIAELRPILTRVVNLFKELVGQIEDDVEQYTKARLTFLLEPYVPKNVSEEITNIVMSKNAGATSTQTAAGEIPFNNPMEYKRLQKEKEEEAEIEEKKQQITALSKQPETPDASVQPPGSTGQGANNQGL